MYDTHEPPTRTPNLVGTRQRLMQLMPTFLLLSSSPFMQTQSQTLAEVSSDQGIRTSRWSARRDSSLTALYYERYIKNPVLWVYHRKAQDRKMKCCRGQANHDGASRRFLFQWTGNFYGWGHLGGSVLRIDHLLSQPPRHPVICLGSRTLVAFAAGGRWDGRGMSGLGGGVVGTFSQVIVRATVQTCDA